MKDLAIALLLIPGSVFATAAFADAYYNHRNWIFPAYYYCLFFCLLLLFGMFIISLISETKTQEITGAISYYLIRHRILAIIVTGVLLAIPLGIIGSVSWEIIWFLSILPALALMIAFPLCLVNRRFREKCLLSPFGMKWISMFSISTIAASLLFIILTNWNLLSSTDVTYLARPGLLHPETHPYDSMKEIWGMPLFFIAEIPMAIILYWFGLLNRYLCRRLSELRHRKKETFHDINNCK